MKNGSPKNFNKKRGSTEKGNFFFTELEVLSLNSSKEGTIKLETYLNTNGSFIGYRIERQ